MQLQTTQTRGFDAALKTLPLILFALAALMLANCTGTTVALGGAAVGMVATKPSEPPPADTEHQIAQHESWCYETSGYAECYAHPQKDAGNRLINVTPENLYPLTPRAYYEATVEDQ